MPFVQKFLNGFKIYLRGVRWLRSRPLMMILSFAPLLLGVFVVFSLMTAFINQFDQVMSYILFDKPESWWMLVVYYLAFSSSVLGVTLVVLLCGFLVPTVIASPLYDYISMKVESFVTGEESVELSLWNSIRLIGEELKKAIFILLISVIAIFIPFLNILVPAWLISWEFYDYPLARRGYSFRKRVEIVRGDFWAVAGMSVWFMIPFVQFFLMPMAVAGGTMLALQSAKR